MVVIKHVKRAVLEEAEQVIAAMKTPLTIIGVTNYGGHWYIHYTVFIDDRAVEVKTEAALPTKVKKIKG